jgi:uncharacterized glyoxalase superfamily protein PhnB
MSLVLYPRTLLPEDATVPMDCTGHSSFTLAYNVPSESEVEAVLQEAKAAGATIIKSAKKAEWGGYSGYFAGPDQFLWEVAYNP